METNTCVDRCPAGKSFNIYASNASESCIDFYDVLDMVVVSNSNLKTL